MKKKKPSKKEKELNPNDGGQGQLIQCLIDLAARSAELGNHELSVVLFVAAGAQVEGSAGELALLCGEFAKLRMAIEKGMTPKEIEKLLKKDLELDEDL
jgi:hypothetical protein